MRGPDWIERLIMFVFGPRIASPAKPGVTVRAGRYAALIGVNAALFIGSVVLGCVTAVGLVACAGLLIVGTFGRGHAGQVTSHFILCALGSVASGLLAVRLKRVAQTVLCHTEREITIRIAANARASEPAEILLRGAARPIEKQESVLLRAAKDRAHESEAEQLLRPGDAT